MPLSTSPKPSSLRRGLAAAVLCAASVAVAGCTIGDVERDDATVSDQSNQSRPAQQGGKPKSRGPQPTTGASTPEKSQGEQRGELGYDGAATIAVAGISGAGDTSVAPWSTAKVPIAIAALRNDPSLQGAMTQAIQNSDNAAAETLWGSLGSPEQAAEATGAVIREGDSSARVESQVVRPGFSSFGQSDWSLSAQADFASHLRCIQGAEPVVSAMGNIGNGGGYGLGTIAGAIFKGGWGPNAAGAYGLRQFGLIPKSDGAGSGYVAVAIAVESPDGSYEAGQAELTAAAEFLQSKVDSLPEAAC